MSGKRAKQVRRLAKTLKSSRQYQDAKVGGTFYSGKRATKDMASMLLTTKKG